MTSYTYLFKKALFLLMVVLFLIPMMAHATDGALDTTFNRGIGVNVDEYGNIYDMAIQPDGKIVVVGWLTKYDGVPRNYIARLNTDGSLDTTFNPGTGADYVIYATALQADGKIIIGGAFRSYNGTTRNYVARLNTDGSLDTDFNPKVGPNNGIFDIAVQPNGKILIAGGFTMYKSTPSNFIARLNANGSLDTTFDSGIGANDGGVDAVVVQPNGKIVIGGWFTMYDGVPRKALARINADGSLDKTYVPATDATAAVNALLVQPDGKIVLSGWFGSYGGVVSNNIARTNADGSLDETFNSGVGANNGIVTMALQSTGKIVIGGWFTQYGGVGRTYVARTNADGSLDETFDPGVGPTNPIIATAIQADSKILIASYFSTYNNMRARGIARLTSTVPPVCTIDSFTGTLPAVYTSYANYHNLAWTTEGCAGVSIDGVTEPLSGSVINVTGQPVTVWGVVAPRGTVTYTLTATGGSNGTQTKPLVMYYPDLAFTLSKRNPSQSVVPGKRNVKVGTYSVTLSKKVTPQLLKALSFDVTCMPINTPNHFKNVRVMMGTKQIAVMPALQPCTNGISSTNRIDVSNQGITFAANETKTMSVIADVDALAPIGTSFKTAFGGDLMSAYSTSSAANTTNAITIIAP